MKLSKGKVTYPGRKQVFRVQDKRGRFVKDVLGLEKEKIEGKPLLIKVVDKGSIIYKQSSIDKIRALLNHGLLKFTEDFKSIHSRYTYPVVISRQLKKLRQDLASQLEKRQ
jgi:nicotinate phosphoribosyltransferase